MTEVSSYDEEVCRCRRVAGPDGHVRVQLRGVDSGINPVSGVGMAVSNWDSLRNRVSLCAVCCLAGYGHLSHPSPVAEVAARPAAAAITSGRRLDVRAAVIAAII